jgi:heme oxygenase
MTILELLRHETQHSHRALETQLDVLRHTCDLTTYRRLVQRFWGVYAPLEAQLCAQEHWRAHEGELAPRLKTPLLERDMRALGGDGPAPPQCAALPPLDGRAGVFGCLYVLEGATLGGQLITRQLQRNLAIGPENGAAFFSSYGRLVGPMWQRFRALLSEQVAGPEDERAALASAQATFDCFRAWFAAPGERA